MKTPASVQPVAQKLSPSRMVWTLDDLLTQDGHRLTMAFTCRVATVNEPAEQKLLDETFSPAGLNSQSIVAHFLPLLRSIASEFARKQNAESLMAVAIRSQWITALKSSANETAFSCGLEVLAPFEVEITSPTLQQERLEQMQRIATERRSADRVGHLARSAELLKHWESLKASVPAITPGKLLGQVNPADRGMMLDTLLMAGAAEGGGKTQPDLWAVSGPYLLRIDAKLESPQPKLIPLPSTVGPLRSVRSDDRLLLIGARSGVLIIDPYTPDAARVYRHPSLVSEHGFTSVTTAGDRVWACHRQGGLVAWNMSDPQNPAVIINPAQLDGEPKHLVCANELFFAVGCRVMKILPNGQLSSVIAVNSAVVGLFVVDGQILIASESGVITLLDLRTLETTSETSTTGRLSGAALLPWLSSTRLLLNRVDGAIDCIGLEDQLVTQFSAGHTGMRAASACAGKVAAMSSDRQKLLLWNAWDGRRTAAEIYVTGITHHRIADVAFA